MPSVAPLSPSVTPEALGANPEYLRNTSWSSSPCFGSQFSLLVEMFDLGAQSSSGFLLEAWTSHDKYRV